MPDHGRRVELDVVAYRRRRARHAMGSLRGMRGGSRARRGAPVLTSRARIHFAALNQFAAHGYAGTTLRAIATEAG